MRERGFTYIGLLLAIALAGAVLSMVAVLWSTESKRERELELLFVGDQFRQAIVSYYDAAPAGQPLQFPAKIEDLLQDKRWPATRRHLRKVFVDPITGSREWGLVLTPSQRIQGVYSISPGVPLKKAGFAQPYNDFTAAKTYSGWIFAYEPPLPTPTVKRPTTNTPELLTPKVLQ